MSCRQQAKRSVAQLSRLVANLTAGSTEMGSMTRALIRPDPVSVNSNWGRVLQAVAYEVSECLRCSCIPTLTRCMGRTRVERKSGVGAVTRCRVSEGHYAIVSNRAYVLLSALWQTMRVVLTQC
jgi:hypothetical protein